MTVLKRTKPQTVNPFTMMSIPCKQHECSETEDETTDHSEDPLSLSESSSFSSWDTGLDVPAIDSSFRQMKVDIIPESQANPIRRSCLKRRGSKRRASIKQTGEMELNLPMLGSPVRKRTCVSFKNSVKVRHVVPVYKLTHDKESLWFQASEYIRIEKRCHLIAQKVMRGEDHNGRALCSRGLESLMCPHRRRDSKFDGWLSVFAEQGLQRQEGHHDDDKLRIMYRATAMASSIEAQKRGMDDEQDVEKYMLATRAMCEKLKLMNEVRTRIVLA
ncbi:unnamed protein product [Cylindrotheca closterium]|uniref:Uncharacterized protein n=1 Tax=Cylindrotheca closterium TaxID=2856 RepID=A0AAD2G7J8_9STRA|nr:unnamed protein product [Cylindrotheca closterium]